MFDQKIKRIISQLDDVIRRAKDDATQQIFVNSLNRIFDKGQDKYENQIGKYNPNFAINGKNYIELRKSKGLQTQFVDLTFTTSLNKSIVADNEKIFFKNTYGQTIAKANEKNFNKRIFAPSRTDKKIFFEFLNDEMIKLWK
mgnify:FL=1|jgi:hypothetical protein